MRASGDRGVGFHTSTKTTSQGTAQWLACLAMKVSRIFLVALFSLAISGCECPVESGPGGSPTGSSGPGGESACQPFDDDACQGDYFTFSGRCAGAFGLAEPYTCAAGATPEGCESLSLFSPGASVDCGDGPLELWCCPE